ncbi:DUF2130 domain-containing protein [Campylobacter sp. FMV-PI01]|uniref:DUF2130 domain-containing protein n=1 Tax=Campylobacter portucalensis TaxID=2608384 RepID=A0A6L5WHV1_9BACT|nr:DUF2130 domain-containing protein [Campylobacter portucalensis]MSN96614.1 DUF2130 domain-containing protein [Campylobacter portucalensis]
MNSNIKCPKCGFLIDIGKIQNEKLREEFNAKFLDLKKDFDLKTKALNEEKAKFDESLQNALNLALKKERENLQKSIKEEFEMENLAQLRKLNDELNEKSAKISALNKINADFEALKREKNELENSLKLKFEEKLTEAIKIEQDKILQQINSQNELKIKQIQEEKEQLIKKINELQRNSEVVSQQLQGEIQELAIEEFLKDKFIYDNIQEIPKGVNGADCIQIVNDKMNQCGKILYESKRTKSFQNEWIDKFKQDIIKSGADVGVLVTQTMPKNTNKIELINGIWVCNFEEFKSFCGILRQGLIDIYYAKNINKNRSEKMDMLYNYLTSNEFKLQVSAIIETFVELKSNLEKEKNAMQNIWKKREKMIERAKDNAILMHASIKGIAGNEIPAVEVLELDYKEDFDS